jgi:glyoxylase-like metal-dependent hydrolase (beta-lactamase superfamily II)
MNIETLVFNPIQENTYIISAENNECAIIDAGCYSKREFEQLDTFISKHGLKPVLLINTHCHFDHLMGVSKVRASYNLKWGIHASEAQMVEMAVVQGDMFGVPMEPITPADFYLTDGETITLGNEILKVIHVPGHSIGSICFYSETDKFLISGDVLFAGSIGRTDLIGGDYPTLISGIKNKLLTLPDDVRVYPGHGPSTTIGYERKNNPYLSLK